ncbi:unnamed protein product [Brassica rapa]|uniref:Uncharacterized protein n=1 Tax=Brassica campestris TaxID=3711 RepID=A0A8D9D954_BRACM|nr:unnamed protein product [Brassica rapa]
MKTALESYRIWSNHVKEEPLKVRAAEKDQTISLEEIQVKVEPLKEVAAEEGQTTRLKVHEANGVIYSLRQGKEELYQLVGRLREVESELGMVKTHKASPSWCQGRRNQDVIFRFLIKEICELVKHICDVWEINKKPDRWKRGISCKKGKLRKLSKMWFMMSRLWRKDIKECMQVGECSYSAYMGESVESSGVMRKLETKGADECTTKEEWDEFVKYVYALGTTRREGAPAKASTSNKPIIVDSGASHHIISDRSLMDDVKNLTC